MPFENYGSRSFTSFSIAKNAPAASGVYGLSNARQWIYVGATTNIQAELRRHLQDPEEFLVEYRASGFTYELSPDEYRAERRNELVVELDPVGNRLVGEAAQ